MPWCKHCSDVCPVVRDEDRGYTCCQGCGRVLDQDIYYSGVTFEKTSTGQSRLAGAFIRSIQSEYSLSHERTLMKGRDEIRGIVTGLSVAGGDSIIDQAHAFYKIAVERNFTRGRITSQVAAACLYIACRQNTKPYLLIDFSDFLQINVYVLGAVFLQLCKLLRLEEHPIVQKPVDPSLFIHRFSERLLGEKNSEVIKIALRIIASMKRDWMQTGRKPSGLCGAALYIAALSQGLRYSKSDVVSVVYVCEATLTKRLIEFENTESGSLTIEEFLTKADELESEYQMSQVPTESSDFVEILCEHKDRGGVHFAHGLCKECYDEFVEISGGLQGGSEPPAFLHAEMQRLETAAADEKLSKLDSSSDRDGVLPKAPENTGSPTRLRKSFSHSCKDEDLQSNTIDEETLSDIDDSEVIGYLHNEEEKHLKKIIWEKMNKEYLEEQAAKEAAAAAAKEAYEAAFVNCSDEIRFAQELATAAAAAAAKSRKERKMKRAEEAKKSGPARTAAEATRQMLKRKAFSSKINYEALDTLFGSEGQKKQRMESDDGCEPEKLDNTPNLGHDPAVKKYDDNDDAAQDVFGDYAGSEYEGYNDGNEEDFEFEVD